MSSIDYKIQHHVTSGAKFGYQYQPGLFIYRLDETNALFTPKFPLDTQVLIHTHSPPHLAKIVGIPSYDHPDVYTVFYPDGSLSEYSDQDGIIELAPVSQVSTMSSLLPPWVFDNTNATLFLSNMN